MNNIIMEVISWEKRIAPSPRARLRRIYPEGSVWARLHSFCQQREESSASFHPLAATGVCTQQMKALEAHFAAITALNTLPVGISVDAVPS